MTYKKIAIFCSFHLFSYERLHIIKWNFVYSLIIIKSKSSVFLGMINQFLTEIFPLDLDITPYSCINILQFPFMLFAEILHAHWIKFGIPVQIYHNNVQVKFCFGFDWAIYGRVICLGIGKIPISCSFRSISSEVSKGGEHTFHKYLLKLHLLHRWLLVHSTAFVWYYYSEAWGW